MKATVHSMMTGTSFLLAALLLAMGAACGGSNAATPGGDAMDGADPAAGSDLADGASPGDGVTAGDGVTVPDGVTAADGSDLADGLTPPDGEGVSGGEDLSVGEEVAEGLELSDGVNPQGAQPVALGMAGGFVILAKTGISTVPTSAVTGNLGISPAAATFITGFSLTADSTNVFSTSPQVTGKVYAADYATPTPANLTAAVGDMLLAFADAAGRAPDVTELGAGSIGGRVLDPGVYKWSTSLLIPADVTLNGSATDVWILQVAGDLAMSSGAKVLLTGGALPRNVFWQVAGLVDLGTTAHCEGVVLVQTSVTMRTGASVNGRLLAQTAVNIDSSTVVEPAP